jgi:uncharacterized damage-inducible protein DinB
VERPERSECAEYYFLYIDQVPAGNVLELLEEQLQSTPRFLREIPADKLDYRYRPGKWTIKQVVGHIIDSERAFAHRAFCFARRDPAELPSFEQEPYVLHSRYAERSLEDILAEYEAVRRATLALFRSFSADEWARRGRATGREFTVRTFPFIVAGHEIHHWEGIRRNYLG